MELLIVDDQKAVINGLLDGIDWASLGIKTVQTAMNALEAKAVFRTRAVDIVLCDIEMPVETGVDLFRWVKAEGYSPYFVFLTSHTEFSYAQEALRLGAADYIVQPAPYSEVIRVVEKAIVAVSREQEKKQNENRGAVLAKQQKMIASASIRSLLAGHISRKEWGALAELGLLPALDREGYLVMLQIIRWHTVEERWTPALLEFGLENVISEISLAYNQFVGVAAVEDDLYAVLFQGRNGEKIPQGALTQQLYFLNSVCVQYFQCDIACYLQAPERVELFDRSWRVLRRQMEDNVSRAAGIFIQEEMGAEPEYRFQMSKVRYWKKLLSEGYFQTVEVEAVQLLNQLVQENNLNRETLRGFYQDFMQMCYVQMDEQGRSLGSIFTTAEEMELYRNGSKSVQQMQELIRYTLRHLNQEAGDTYPQAVTQQVIEYIQNHLEEDLRRDDIAAYVHLNRDYLSRVFSKEMGVSLKEYITEQKMKAAQGMLRTTNFPINFIGAKMGYCNASHFSSTYKKAMGRTPQEERALKEE